MKIKKEYIISFFISILANLIFHLMIKIKYPMKINISYYLFLFSSFLLILAFSILMIKVYKRWRFFREIKKFKGEYSQKLSLELKRNYYTKNAFEHLMVNKCSSSYYYLQERRTVSMFSDSSPHSIMDKFKKLRKRDLIILIGSAGTGKTFFLNQFALYLCDRKPRQTIVKKVPILISLNLLNTKFRNENLEKSISDYAERLGLSASTYNFLHERGEIFYMLDGFNEVADPLSDYSNYLSLKNQLISFLKSAADLGSIGIITSRELIFKDFYFLRDFESNGFESIQIQMLNIKTIYKLSLDILSNKGLKKKFSTEFKKQGKKLTLYNRLMDINFLVECFEFKKKLPKYYELFDYLIRLRISRSYGESNPIVMRKYVEFFRDLAFYITKKYYFSGFYIDETIENLLYGHSLEMESVLKLGFLRLLEDGQLIFSHQEWQEYFTAIKLEILFSNDVKRQDSLIKKPYFDSAFVLLCSKLSDISSIVDSAINVKRLLFASFLVRNSNSVKEKYITRLLREMAKSIIDYRYLTTDEIEKIKKEKESTFNIPTFEVQIFGGQDIQHSVMANLGIKSLKSLLHIICSEKDDFIRSCAIYFIQIGKIHLSENFGSNQIHVLVKALENELNPHVVFHMISLLSDLLPLLNSSDEAKVLASLKTLTAKANKMIAYDNIFYRIINCWELILMYSDYIQKKHTSSIKSISNILFLIYKFLNSECDSIFSELANITKIPVSDRIKLEEYIKNENIPDYISTLELLEISLHLSLHVCYKHFKRSSFIRNIISKALKNPLGIIKWWAIFNLGKIKKEWALRLLKQCLFSENLPDIQLACIRMLKEFNDPRVKFIFQTFLESKSNSVIPEVYNEVANALIGLGVDSLSRRF